MRYENYKNMDKETLIKIIKNKDIKLKNLRSKMRKLNYYSNTDTMTRVLNRRSGLALLDREFNLSKINDKNFTVCFVDVDRLKLINDTFGHDEGDRALKSTAKILRESIRKTDFIIRMGGDEFLIVFSQTTIQEANKVMGRIDKRLQEINKSNDKYNLSLSYGFYEYSKKNQGEMSIKDLIKRADSEMYKKKMQKRRNFNNICRINKNINLYQER